MAPALASILLPLVALLAACSPPPLPPDVAPPQGRPAPVVYRKGAPAADVQPEPTNSLVRDGRAESLLAYIGAVEGHVGRADEELRLQRKPDTCLQRVLVELRAVARKARACRSELREAAFEDPAAEDRLFRELAGFGARAHQLGAQCGQLAAYRGGQDYEVSLRALEARVDGLKDQISKGAPPVQVQADMVLVSGVLHGAPAVRRTSSSSSMLRSVGSLFAAGPAKPQIVASPTPAPPAPPPPAGPPVAPPAGSPFAQGPHDTSLLLRSAQVTLAVYEVEKKMDAVQTAAVALGGYLALRGDRELTVRVPRERFDEALKRIEAVGDVLHRSVAAEDVTDQFVDLELRLKNAHAVRARLEKLLEAATVKDAVEIHKELARVTEEIERLEGKLKLLRDRIAFSTITVTFERTEPQKVRSQALLPFPWMRTMGLGPLLQVTR